MKLDTLELHPQGYLKLKTPLNIYFNDSVSPEDFETVCEALSKRRSALPINGKHMRGKSGEYWSYFLNMPTFSLHLGETDSQRGNLFCDRFVPGKGGLNKQYNNPFSQMFLLEAAAGIHLIHQDQTYYIAGTDDPPGTPSGVPLTQKISWNMGDAYHELLERMHCFFEGGDAYVRSPSLSEKAKQNVLNFFDEFTAKEHDYEMRQVDFTNGILYTSREVGAVAKGRKSTYIFYSRHKNADPETCTLTVGNKVVIYNEDESPTGRTGLLVGIDYESRDGALFTLEFYGQFNDAELPSSGYLFVAHNDTQYKIRQAVSKSIRSGRTPAQFMYKTFHDFSVKGYETPEAADHAGLLSFLHKQMACQYPPNQMQLEAIVKGILTDDLLLVLGPPGTGKTTVILAWVEYFISQGKRVLISSQNNAAVDNVLERFKGRGEIIRLGREEKVQESCKEFLPSNRIDLMRRSCRENGERLATQLAAERQQIDRYIAALRELVELIGKYTALKQALNPCCQRMTSLISHINEQYTRRNKAVNDRELARSHNARYEIFLEENRRKNWFIRVWRWGLCRQAKKKIAEGKRKIPQLEEVITQRTRDYTQAVTSLQEELASIRRQDLLQDLLRTKRQMLQLQAQIFTGDDDNPPLVPVFESELRTLAILQERESLDGTAEDTLPQYRREIARMEEVRVAADKLQAASQQWVAAALKDERNEVFEDILLEVCQVVGATCIGINSNKAFAQVKFDVTVIDESGQIQLHNALVPMSRSPKTLMLGDYKQIPPIVNGEIAEACRLDDVPTYLFEQSFFEFLFEQMRRREIDRLMDSAAKWMGLTEEELQTLTPEDKKLRSREQLLRPVVDDYDGTPVEEEIPRPDDEPEIVYHSRYNPREIRDMVLRLLNDPKKIVNLNSQFRMPGHISDVISEWFYESNYFSSYSMKNFSPVVPHTTLPMVIINTAGAADRFESQPESKMGYQNGYEAAVVADIMEAILRPMSEEEQLEYREKLGKRLGIISAYGAQVRAIRHELTAREGVSFSATEANTAVASLDSFQGQERDLIIYSLTRSSRTKRPTDARVGFLKELRRLNVAFTRCKKQLVIIGDLDYLQECLYVDKDADAAALPCAGTVDGEITLAQINQCAECPVECERRFARFFRLLMQHVQRAENPAGDLFAAKEFRRLLKGGDNDEL